MICFKRVTLAVIFVLCQAVALSSAQAATYYVRSGGSNSNSGLSWGAAWAHPNKTNGIIAAGDIVYFAPARYDSVDIRPPRGGTAWTEYRCSTETARSSTILSGGVPYNGAWSLYSGSVYRSSSTIPARWNAWNTDGYMTVELDRVMLHCESSLGGVNQSGEYYYDPSSDILYVYGNPTAHELRYAQRPVVTHAYGNQDMILFFGLTIELGHGGILAWAWGDMPSSDASDSIWIVHCNLRKTGMHTSANNLGLIFAGTVGGAYPASIDGWGRFNKVVGCSLSTAWSPDGSLSGGAGIDFYSQRDFTADSNAFFDLKAGGIMFKYGGSTTSSVKAFNMNVRFNSFDGGLSGIWFGGKQDSLTICGNRFMNATYRAIDIHSTEMSGAYSGRVKILNNTFYNNERNITISPTATNATNEVRYNVFFDTTSFTRSIEFVTQGGEAPQQSPALETCWGINDNMYYHGGGAFSCAFTSNSGYSGSSWTNWRSAGFDASGSNGTNPNFASSNLQDFSRPAAAAEMNRTYAGKTWTRFGAWQPTSGGCTLPGVATLSLPANGATGLLLPVTIDWSDVATATSYQLQIDDNSDFSSTQSDQVVAASTLYATGLTSGTTLYWRVRAQNTCGSGAWSASRTFAIAACTLPVAPTLASPANAATNLSQPITLDWNDVATATGYQIQVDNNSDFSSVTVAPTATASTYALSGLAAGTTYYWRVQAQSACGLGSFSASRSFTTACSLPAVPTFVSPANGATNMAQPIALDWSDVTGATLYQVQVDDNSDFLSTAADNQPSVSTYSVSGSGRRNRVSIGGCARRMHVVGEHGRQREHLQPLPAMSSRQQSPQ